MKRGRPKLGTREKKSYTAKKVYLGMEDYGRLKELSLTLGTSDSDIVRQALLFYYMYTKYGKKI